MKIKITENAIAWTCAGILLVALLFSGNSKDKEVVENKTSYKEQHHNDGEYPLEEQAEESEQELESLEGEDESFEYSDFYSFIFTADSITVVFQNQEKMSIKNLSEEQGLNIRETISGFINTNYDYENMRLINIFIKKRYDSYFRLAIGEDSIKITLSEGLEEKIINKLLTFKYN